MSWIQISGSEYNWDIDNYIIKHYSIEQGLSQSTVFTIYQDSQGYLWFGTRGGGLNRFDGYEFKVFRSNSYDPSSISDNEVISLFEDSKGNFWVGTRYGGVNLYDRDKESFLQCSIFPEKAEKFAANCFFEDIQNNVWIGTDEGLIMYSNETGRFNLTKNENEELREITSIVQNINGNLFIGSRKGIYVFDPLNQTSEIITEILTAENNQLEQSNMPLLLDSDERLWYGTPKGIFKIDDNEKAGIIENPLNIPILNSKQIRTINEDRNGNIWIGFKGGLISYNPLTDQHLFFKQTEDPQYSLGHNSVHSLFEDKNGNVWVGTWGGGITLLSHFPRRFFHFKHIPYQNSLSDNTISSFAEDNNGLWIGTENGGLNYYNYSKRDFRVYTQSNSKGLLNNHIKCLYTDVNNMLWIGTWGSGIFLFNTFNQKFENYIPTASVYSITQDVNENIWIGTMNDLIKFDPYTKRIIKQYKFSESASLQDNTFVTFVFNDKKNNIWAGTKGEGLFLYNKIKDQFISYKHVEGDSTSLINDYVICINQDDAGNLWIGTNKGLCRYNYTENNFTDISSKLNLPDNVINGLVPIGDKILWIASNKGISKVDTETNQYVNFDLRDGLQSNEFTRAAYYQSKSGDIFFGGINGYNTFHPDRIEFNPHPPQIIFTNLKIFNQVVRPDDEHQVLNKHISRTSEITLDYKQSLFEIEFVAFNYIVPSRSHYKYKLEGYTDDWIDIGNDRKVSFMNLDDGEYVLRIIASNEDNIWNDEGISLNITVLPPPWRTATAYIIYFFILVLIIFLLQRFISSRYRQKNLMLNEKLEKERLKKLHQMKLRFFTNITHEFRTPLSLISGPLESLIKEKSEKKRQYYFLLIKNNVERLKRLVDQLMDFRKAEHEKYKLHVKPLNIKNFISIITESFSEYALKKEIVFKVTCDGDDEELHWFDPGIIDKILFNLLSNAFKFTPAGGTVEVRVFIIDNQAEIAVIDNGEGISEDKLPHIFERFYSYADPKDTYVSGTGIGLSFSKRLAEIHKGSLFAQSNIGKGSNFTLVFPIDNGSYNAEEIALTSMPETEKEKFGKQIHIVENQEYQIEENYSPKETNLSILIIEDDKELLYYLESHFSKFYKVLLAENGREGLKIAQQRMPDLVITDLMMPKMDGYELCQVLKQDFLTSHIPVVILTAKTEPENALKGIEKGADYYIEKPFEINYLESVIRNLINQRLKIKKRFTVDPQETNIDGITEEATLFISNVTEYIQKHIADSEFSVEKLCQGMGISRSQLFRKFRALMDISPSDYIRIIRLKKAAEMLLKNDYSVNDLRALVGFSNTSHFIAAFRKYFGQTPKDYIKSRQKPV
jgi:ligand-binding sensor domain-containing protein/signal transduction histidine kinase/DNA-binding response OmpR family regulator